MKHVRTLVALLETVRPLSEGGAQPLEADISVGIIIKLLSVETNLERNSWVGPLPTSSSRCSGSDIAHIHHRTCGASGNLELRSLSPLCMYTWRRKSFYRRLQSVPSAFFFWQPVRGTGPQVLVVGQRTKLPSCGRSTPLCSAKGPMVHVPPLERSVESPSWVFGSTA